MTEIAGNFPKTTFIGFGEAGHAIASGWKAAPVPAIRAYDLKLLDPQVATQVTTRCGDAGSRRLQVLSKLSMGRG